MLSNIRNSIFSKILWGLMGLHLLNISVDTADPFPDYVPEDLSFNDQESIVEIIVEQLLGYENAIKEFDDHDPEDHSKKKNLNTKLLDWQLPFQAFLILPWHTRKPFFTDVGGSLSKGYSNTDAPPPQV